MKPGIGSGDKGQTSLCDGSRVLKTDKRVQAYGDVDELNSFIGLAISFTKQQDVKQTLTTVQNHLFTIGSNLARPEKTENTPKITPKDIKFLEATLQKYETELEPLKKFILPGGTQTAALLHVARTVCRRTERAVIALNEDENSNQTYLNRLSDLLFTLARLENKHSKHPETTWKTA